jgi:hypothetical protein
LDIGKTTIKQLLGALYCERFYRIRGGAALIIAAPRIALGIFVGQHRPLRLEHGPRDDVLRRDQLDLILLAVELGGDGPGDVGVGFLEAAGEEARMLDL